MHGFKYREEFARDTLQSLFFLTQGSYKNKNGYNRLLFGRKAVDKTMFLRTMQSMTNKLFENNLITIYHSFDTDDESQLPISIVCSKLWMPVTENIEYLDNELEFKKYFCPMKTARK